MGGVECIGVRNIFLYNDNNIFIGDKIILAIFGKKIEIRAFDSKLLLKKHIIILSSGNVSIGLYILSALSYVAVNMGVL